MRIHHEFELSMTLLAWNRHESDEIQPLWSEFERPLHNFTVESHLHMHQPTRNLLCMNSRCELIPCRELTRTRKSFVSLRQPRDHHVQHQKWSWITTIHANMLWRVEMHITIMTCPRVCAVKYFTDAKLGMTCTSRDWELSNLSLMGLRKDWQLNNSGYSEQNKIFRLTCSSVCQI